VVVAQRADPAAVLPLRDVLALVPFAPVPVCDR